MSPVEPGSDAYLSPFVNNVYPNSPTTDHGPETGVDGRPLRLVFTIFVISLSLDIEASKQKSIICVVSMRSQMIVVVISFFLSKLIEA